MYRLFHNFLNLMAPADTAPAGEMSKEEVIEFLNDDDSEEPLNLEDKEKGKSDEKVADKPDSEETEESDEEEVDDELKEIEEDLEEPDEDKLELATPVRKREILKKYPSLFKDFPALERSYYRDQQFTEVFPTVAEAREAVEKIEALDKYESDLKAGNFETSLAVIKNTNQEAFYKAVDNYLPTLAKVDEKSYHHVIGNVIKHTILSMLDTAREGGNESLQAAATLLNQFVFGNSTWKGITKLSSDKPAEENEEAKRLQAERQEYIRERFEEARDGLNTKVNNSIRSTIDAYIDPKDSMTPYVKKVAVNEAFDTVVNLVGQDPRFKSLLDRLWDNAFKSKFSQESRDKIKSAYLAKAKSVMPAAIKKARIEALKGMGKRVRDTDDKDNDKEESTTSKRARSAPEERERKSGNSPKSVPKGMSTLDYLMAD